MSSSGERSRFARNPALERAILAAPEDPEAYLIYGDWLQGQGDPRGELILLQVTQGDSTRELEVLGALGLPEQEVATFAWRYGFIDTVRLANERDFMDDDFDVLPFVQQIFLHPAALRIRELRLGVIRWMLQHEDVPRVLKEVARLRAAEGLERLVLGDIDEDIDLAHHNLGQVELSAFSGLSSLKVRGSGFRLAELPDVQELIIQTCGLSAESLAAIVGVKRPRLERLQLWFGSTEWGAECQLDDLWPLLDGRTAPRLRALGLMNAEFTDDIADAVSRSAALPGLRVLDLSMGTMGKKGAEAILVRAERFEHLERLIVDDNFLDEETLGRLQRRFAQLISHHQKEELGEEDGAQPRYVSAYE